MKKIKVYSWVCAITAVLCSTSVISIGFATWAVTKGDISGPISGSITADNIDTNIQGVTVTPAVFTMGHYYFEEVDGSNNISYATTGVLSYSLTFDSTKINSDYLSGSNMNIKFTLNYTNDLAIFTNELFEGVKVDSVSESVTPSTTYVEFTKQVSVNSGHTISYEFSHLIVPRFKNTMIGGSFHLKLEAIQ